MSGPTLSMVLGEPSGPGAPWLHLNRTGAKAVLSIPQPDGFEMRVEGTRDEVVGWMLDHVVGSRRTMTTEGCA